MTVFDRCSKGCGRWVTKAERMGKRKRERGGSGRWVGGGGGRKRREEERVASTGTSRCGTGTG